MSEYKERLLRYNKLKIEMQNLNTMATNEFKKGNIEIGRQLSDKRDKVIEKLKQYREDYSVTTGNLRYMIYELLKESGLTKEKLEEEAMCSFGSIENLLSNGFISEKNFNKLFQYFGIVEIKEVFTRYIDKEY